MGTLWAYTGTIGCVGLMGKCSCNCGDLSILCIHTSMQQVIVNLLLTLYTL